MNVHIIDLIGRLYRKFPSFKGKALIGSKILEPLIRGKGYECIVEMNTPGGGNLICNLDDWIPWQVYKYGCYSIEKNYELFMMNVATEASVIIDVGTNIGYYTIQFARLSKGTIFAFEPMSYTFDILRKNIALNNINNVCLLKKVVTEKSGTLRIYFQGMNNTGSSSINIKSEKYEDVQATIIDKLVQEEKLSKIDLMKIDVEGHEFHVINGMKNALEEGIIKNLFLEINRELLSAAGSTPEEICSYLKKFGYIPFSIKSGEKEHYEVGSNESLVYFSKYS